MAGKYLRQIEDDKPRDPTMTHMADPYVVEVGDYVRDAEGCYRVTEIVEHRPGLRFAYLEGRLLPPSGATLHDLGS